MRKESFRKTSYFLFLFTALLFIISGMLTRYQTFAQVQIKEREGAISFSDDRGFGR